MADIIDSRAFEKKPCPECDKRKFRYADFSPRHADRPNDRLRQPRCKLCDAARQSRLTAFGRMQRLATASGVEIAKTNSACLEVRLHRGRKDQATMIAEIMREATTAGIRVALCPPPNRQGSLFGSDRLPRVS